MRNFATRFVRNLIEPFAGDAAPVDPMAAGTTFAMALRKTDDAPAQTSRLQCYFRSNVGGLTMTMQLYVHGQDANWILVGGALAAVPQNRMVTCGLIEDALAFIMLTPSAPLGVGETADFFAEEVSEPPAPLAGLSLVAGLTLAP